MGQSTSVERVKETERHVHRHTHMERDHVMLAEGDKVTLCDTNRDCRVTVMVYGQRERQCLQRELQRETVSRPHREGRPRHAERERRRESEFAWRADSVRPCHTLKTEAKLLFALERHVSCYVDEHRYGNASC